VELFLLPFNELSSPAKQPSKSLKPVFAVSIGENVYKSLDPNTQSQLREILLPDNRWKYINYGTDKAYKVYTLMDG
jgi:hypothetical protein